MSTIVCITVKNDEFFIAAGGGVCPQSVVKLFQKSVQDKQLYYALSSRF